MSGRSKQTDRKVRTARVADFDDQRWPIHCAILILAGFTAGVAIATGDFHAENLLYNTVFRLAAVVAGVAVLFGATIWLQRTMVRRVQLCVLISLLAHLWLGMALHERHLAFVAAEQQAEAARRVIEDDPRMIVPEYHWENIERPESRHTFEEPVETESPKPTDPAPVRPKELDREAPIDKKPKTEPETPQPQQPNPAEVRRAELTAPRRAPLAAGAQISRQEWKQLPEPNEPIPEPEATSPVETTPAVPEAKVAEASRRRSESPRHERQVFEQAPGAATKQDVIELARRVDQPKPLLDAATTPAPTRQLTRPAEVTETEIALPRLTTPRATASRGPAASKRRTVATRSSTASVTPARERPSERETPTFARASQLPTAAARRATASRQQASGESSTAGPRPTLARATSEIEIPSTTLPAPSGAPAASKSVAARPTAHPRATAVTRGGSRLVPTARPNTGSGPTGDSSGAPDRIGVARLARVTRHESISSGISGGGTPSPARALGRVVAPRATIDAPQVAADGPNDDKAVGGPTPLEASTPVAVRQTQSVPPTGNKATAEATLVGVDSAPAVVLPGKVHSTEPDVAALVVDASTEVMQRKTNAVPLTLDTEPVAAPASRPADSPSDLTAEATGPVRPASDVEDARRMAELPGGLTSSRPVVAAEIAGRSSTTPGTVAGPRRLPHGDDPGPSLAAEVSGGPIRKTIAAGLPRGLAESIAEEPIAQAEPDEPDSQLEVASAAGVGVPMRRPGGLPVQIAAKAGPGGLSYEPSPQVGIPSRRARPESEMIHVLSRRFLVARSGGRMVIDGRVQELPTEAFRQRDPGKRARAVEIYGGTEGTERAVEMGLEFFTRCQFADGHWSLDQLPDGMESGDEFLPGQMGSDTAATGLALLSFFGAGYTHQSDKHRETVGRGLDWLVSGQKPEGDLFTGGSDYTWFYSHGIATIALCEAYGMTRDPRLREPAQKAVRFIVDSQDSDRGGWRYRPRIESDTSVSGWQLMALKSAQMAGLKVPRQTLRRVSDWLDKAQADGGSRYVYNPHAGNTPTQRPGRRPNLAMTAEGVLMRMYLGWKSDHAAMVDAAEYLKQNLPEVGTAEQPTRDAYYWYYATQVMFQMQGDYWDAWNNRLQPLLESSQDQTGRLSGSWNPTTPIRDRWAHAGGRVYVTAMNLLMLEVYYRHLPLFQSLDE